MGRVKSDKDIEVKVLTAADLALLIRVILIARWNQRFLVRRNS